MRVASAAIGLACLLLSLLKLQDPVVFKHIAFRFSREQTPCTRSVNGLYASQTKSPVCTPIHLYVPCHHLHTNFNSITSTSQPPTYATRLASHIENPHTSVNPEMASAQGKSDPRPGGSVSGTVSLVGPSKSQEASSSRTTTTSTGVQTNDARNKDEKQPEPMAQNSWDGVVTDKPTFPLSEIMALKRCNFSAHFYVYTRLNGRTGVIARDLIEDILEKCTILPDVQPDADAERANPKVERRESKGKGKGKAKDGKHGKHPRATAADVATNSDQALEFPIPCPIFEQVCKDLTKSIENMDMSRYTQSERQKTNLCLETIRAVSDRAKELSKRFLAQDAAAASLSSSTPSVIDPKTHCVVPCPAPWDGEPCGRRLPCVAHSMKEEDPEKNPLSGIPVAKDLSESDPVQVVLLPTTPY